MVGVTVGLSVPILLLEYPFSYSLKKNDIFVYEEKLLTWYL